MNPNPAIIVILGAAGDLTHRKLIPALYNLFLDQHLPEKLLIIGVDRMKWDQTAFQNHLHEGVDQFSRRGKTDEATWRRFSALMKYFPLDFTLPEAYLKLSVELDLMERSWKEKTNRIFYLATAPEPT